MTDNETTRLEELKAKIAAAKQRKEQSMKIINETDTATIKLETELKKKDKEVAAVKEMTGRLHRNVENEEEHITNNLTKRLDALQREKRQLQQQADKEESIATTLSSKLDTLKREKIEIENRLEQEQELIVNKLQQELLKLSEEKIALQTKLHHSRGVLLKKLGEQMKNTKAPLANDETISKLASEISRLQEGNDKAESRIINYEEERKELSTMLERLRMESVRRQNEQHQLKQELDKVTSERKELFITAEQLLERRINMSLRNKQTKKRSSRIRSVSELSETDSLSSSVCSSSLSTPKLYDSYPLPHYIINPPTSEERKRSSSVPIYCTSSKTPPASQRTRPYHADPLSDSKVQ
eukprot:TRINITY_DN13595_c0_g1_i1.p1 TRINITY_DN13595_c0_g1~~TRINITY_DN13595_c0_g1_i1.p1  ORF type:complete len:377 (+),score=107.94 TRINITY_DN13595_c0_g1_i1:69-1133(+)